MSRKISPFLGVSYGWEYGENNWNTGMDENLKKFSFFLDGNLDGVVSVLPNPIEGTAYYSTSDNKLHYVVGGVYSDVDAPSWSKYSIKTTGDVYQKRPDGSFLITQPPISQVDGDSRYQQLSQIGTTGAQLIASASAADGRSALELQTTAYVLSRANHTGTQAISTINNLQTSLDGKVDKVTGKQLSTEDYTTAEKTKLSGLVSSHYRGTFTTPALLTSGVASPVAGDYARVDPGVGTDVLGYIWDVNDTKWVAQTLSAAQVKTLYESNANTNAYITSDKTVVTNLSPLSPLPTTTTNTYGYKPGTGWTSLSTGGGTPLLFHIQDQRPSGTPGGNATTSSWNIRTLNTVVINQIPSASVASDVITLPSGTYYFDGSSANFVTRAKSRIYNITDSTSPLIGTSESHNIQDTSLYFNIRAFVFGIITITTTKTFRLETYTINPVNGNNFGYPTSEGTVNEVYNDLKIWKLA